MKFKFLEHTADIKFQAFGDTIEEVFENSALAMFNTMHDGKIKSKKSFKIKVKGKDFESLLYNFLEELLFLFDVEGFFLSNIKSIKIDGKKFKLEAVVFGDDVLKYKMHLGIKAITYNDMFVKKVKGKWVAQVVLDV